MIAFDWPFRGRPTALVCLRHAARSCGCKLGPNDISYPLKLQTQNLLTRNLLESRSASCRAIALIGKKSLALDSGQLQWSQQSTSDVQVVADRLARQQLHLFNIHESPDRCVPRDVRDTTALHQCSSVAVPHGCFRRMAKRADARAATLDIRVQAKYKQCKHKDSKSAAKQPPSIQREEHRIAQNDTSL